MAARPPRTVRTTGKTTESSRRSSRNSTPTTPNASLVKPNASAASERTSTNNSMEASVDEDVAMLLSSASPTKPQPSHAMSVDQDPNSATPPAASVQRLQHSDVASGVNLSTLLDEDDEQQEIEVDDDADELVDGKAPQVNDDRIFGDSDIELTDPEATEDEVTEEEPDEEEEEEQDPEEEFFLNQRDRRLAKASQVKPKRQTGWVVPYDPVVIGMPDRTVVERVIAHDMKELPDPVTGFVSRYLVKFKHTSYLDCELIDCDRLINEYGAIKKIRSYMLSSRQASIEMPFDASYKQADRVLDEGELPDPVTGKIQVYVLTKWMNQSHDQSTWEPIERIEKLNPEALREFQERRRVPDNIPSKPVPRPPASAFVSMNESPEFKGDRKLRDYQVEGLNWFLFRWIGRTGCIMADEMGLGKTVQSVAFVYEVFRRYRIRGPFLIVAPLSTLPHWEREFRGWTDLNTIVFKGPVDARNLLIDTEFYYKDAQNEVVPGAYKFHVLITTYEILMNCEPQLKPIPWRIAIFDEAHRLKNKDSKAIECLKGFKLKHKVLLTGTPIQNSSSELFSLLNFLFPEQFPTEKQFAADYGSLDDPDSVTKIQKLLQPILLRRFKEDVETSIPVKEETVIQVELTPVQKKWYRAIFERNFNYLRKGTNGRNGPTLTNVVMELRKCCMHPYLIADAERRILEESGAQTAEEAFNLLVASSGKLVLVDKLLKKLHGGHKVLIFSQMTKCLDLLSLYLDGREYPYERIDGSVKGDKRQEAIDRFSTSDRAFVFLLCTRAGGVGINLTAADTVIIYDSDWNPQNDLQAQARCHRIGQTKTVKIYRLVTRNTYETEMFDRASLKLGLDKAVLQQNDVSSALQARKTKQARHTLKRHEVEQLLKKGAYGALMDDEEESKKFCDEDIDHILERRTTVVRHEANERGSIFSKATFTAGPGQDIDVNDPDFWDKWASKGNIEVTSLEDLETQRLIIDKPRVRRRVKRFSHGEQAANVAATHDVVGEIPESGLASDFDPDEVDELEDDEDLDDETSVSNTPAQTGKTRMTKEERALLPLLWTGSERVRLERELAVWGYGRWEKMIGRFPKRSIADLRVCTRSLVIFWLRTSEGFVTEFPDLARDILEVLDTYGDTLTAAEADFNAPYNPPTPYPNATEKQIAEFRSFLFDAPAEATDRIRSKSRYLLSRIQLMFTICERIVPKDYEAAKRLPVPKVGVAPIAPWWGEAEDRDLLIGVCRYGYQRYHHMLDDPDLCFYDRRFNRDSLDTKDDPKEKGAGIDVEMGEAGTASSDQTVSAHADSTSISVMSVSAMLSDAPLDSSPGKGSSHADQESEKPLLTWPSRSLLGSRLRKLVESYVKSRIEKRPVLSQTTRSQPAVALRRLKGLAAKPFTPDPVYFSGELTREQVAQFTVRWNKREQTSFYKTLYAFGVEETDFQVGDDESPIIDWRRFRELAHLSEKPVRSLDQFYGLIQRWSKIVVQTPGEMPHLSRLNEEDRRIARAIDVDLTYYTRERATRTVERPVLFNRLRRHLQDPNIELKLRKAKFTNNLPNWWARVESDRDLIMAVTSYGLTRTDLWILDTDLSFHSHFRDYFAIDPESGDLTLVKGSKPIILRETIIVKRLEYLANHLDRPFIVEKPLAHKSRAYQEDPILNGSHAYPQYSPRDPSPYGHQMAQSHPSQSISSAFERGHDAQLFSHSSSALAFESEQHHLSRYHYARASPLSRAHPSTHGYLPQSGLPSEHFSYRSEPARHLPTNSYHSAYVSAYDQGSVYENGGGRAAGHKRRRSHTSYLDNGEENDSGYETDDLLEEFEQCIRQSELLSSKRYILNKFSKTSMTRYSPPSRRLSFSSRASTGVRDMSRSRYHDHLHAATATYSPQPSHSYGHPYHPDSPQPVYSHQEVEGTTYHTRSPNPIIDPVSTPMYAAHSSAHPHTPDQLNAHTLSEYGYSAATLEGTPHWPIRSENGRSSTYRHSPSPTQMPAHHRQLPITPSEDETAEPMDASTPDLMSQPTSNISTPQPRSPGAL